MDDCATLLTLLEDLLCETPGSIRSFIVDVLGCPSFLQFTETSGPRVLVDWGFLPERRLSPAQIARLHHLQFEVEQQRGFGTAMKAVDRTVPDLARQLVQEVYEILTQVCACDAPIRLDFSIVEYR